MLQYRCNQASRHKYICTKEKMKKQSIYLLLEDRKWCPLSCWPERIAVNPLLHSCVSDYYQHTALRDIKIIACKRLKVKQLHQAVSTPPCNIKGWSSTEQLRISVINEQCCKMRWTTHAVILYICVLYRPIYNPRGKWSQGLFGKKIVAKVKPCSSLIHC